MDHGHGASQPLVAAAGVDGHRRVAAGHAGVRGCGGQRCGLHLGPALGHHQHGAAHLLAPGAAQAFLGDGHVAVNLLLQQGRQVGVGCQVRRLGIGKDAIQRHAAAVGQGAVRGLGLQLQHNVVIQLPQAHPVMGAADHGHRPVGGAGHLHPDVDAGFLWLHLQAHAPHFHQPGSLLADVVGGVLQQPQGLVGVGAQRAQGGSDAGALPSAGLWYKHRVGVLDHRHAGGQIDALHGLGQQLASAGGGQGDGNGFGASQGQHQLLLQNAFVICHGQSLSVFDSVQPS